MNILEKQLKGFVDIELFGDKKHSGILVDVGQDILVIYNGVQFVYLPMAHIQNIVLNPQNVSYEISDPPELPIDNEKQITYRKVLTNSKGIFIEIFVTGHQPIHGYVTHIMTNYFEFYSPVYKTMFIPLFHLKWIIPYNEKQTPYSLDKKFLPVNPSDIPLSRIFEDQLKKLEGKIVVFDLGGNANKIGLLHHIENNIVELITADGKKLLSNIQHIKSVHSPSL